MKASKQTIIRTVVLIFALINQVLVIFGFNPLPYSNEEFYEAMTLLWTVGASLWSWWKNNSFTEAAIKADEYKDKLKAGEGE